MAYCLRTKCKYTNCRFHISRLNPYEKHPDFHDLAKTNRCPKRKELMNAAPGGHNEDKGSGDTTG